MRTALEMIIRRWEIRRHMDDLFTVILAGGSGTRFWPASRKARPKQLLPIGRDPDQSLIAATVRRIEALCPPERTLIATGAHLLQPTRRALSWLPESSFLGEPIPKNTAPCIAWASAIARRRNPNALVMVLPSDHHISDVSAFHDALSQALLSAVVGPITTIGILPSRPDTGYGYIEAGEDFGAGLMRVVRFVEKPTLERAEEYVAGGRHFWNAGMFFFRASVMLEAIEEHAPEIAAGVARIEAAAGRGADAEAAETARAFDEMPAISIDYAVMEKVTPMNVVVSSFGWSDLGSWESAWELADKDADGNAAPPGAVLVESRNNLVRDLSSHARSKRVALVGVEDLCVVETDDALLVIPRARSQDVRHVVAELGKRGEDEWL
jgi:mannose-1-phosphate guanylyltransferase